MKTYEEALSILRDTRSLINLWDKKAHDPYAAPELQELALQAKSYYTIRLENGVKLVALLYEKGYEAVAHDLNKPAE